MRGEVIMKRLLFLVLLIAAAMGAAAHPVVSGLTPASGPAAGGTEVVITGSNLLPTIVCALPCPSTVTFGGVTVEVQQESATRLVVVTPAHVPGTVDVIVQVSGEDPVRLSNAFTFDGGIESAYEPVLLPVYVDGVIPGAHGSQWASDLWIRNNGEESVFLAPWPCPEGQACPPVFPLPYNLLSGLSVHNLPAQFKPPSPNPSRLLYIARNGAADVSLSLRIADVSRGSLNAGTEIPAIRENEALLRPSQIFDIPMSHDFRVLLRVYDVAYTESRFRVTLYPQKETNDQPVHTEELAATTAQSGAFRTEAAYAQLDITDLLRLEKVWPARVRIQVTPLTPGSRYWAFASITNNETQLVTVASPQ